MDDLSLGDHLFTGTHLHAHYLKGLRKTAASLRESCNRAASRERCNRVTGGLLLLLHVCCHAGPSLLLLADSVWWLHGWAVCASALQSLQIAAYQLSCWLCP